MPVRFLSSDEETKLQQSKEEYQPKFEAFGRPVPIPFADENNDEFRRRALAKLQPLERFPRGLNRQGFPNRTKM